MSVRSMALLRSMPETASVWSSMSRSVAAPCRAAQRRQFARGMASPRAHFTTQTPDRNSSYSAPRTTISSSIWALSQKPSRPLSPAALPQWKPYTTTSGTSQSTLTYLEETANKNPNNATHQVAFYQALWRANMPAIIVERFQANRFATNSTCENLYHRALGALEASGNTASAVTTSQGTSIKDMQLQAVGQALAAKSKGGNIAVAAKAGSDVVGSPLHVVVQESMASHIFKYVKFFFSFAAFVYIAMILITMLFESTQTLKKMGGKAGNEAKAEHQKVRFADVHGCDEAKEELQELVEFLRNPEKFSTLGGKLPRGVLLVGPPGTGKTLLARAVAGESGVPFFFMSGSEFDEMFVGVGAKRVRELFAAAKGKSPAIVFIDEIDAIGGKRSPKDPGYAKQTLNQLLTELDGFEQNSGVIILAATNFPEMLDKALTRPGRFDRNVVVGLPDVRGRIAILGYHMQNIKVDTDVSVEALAAGTPGFSGADLENIVNQAAVHASRSKSAAVNMLDLEWAKDKIMMGAEKRSMVINDTEKEMTAYHEAGHALCMMFTPRSEPLHKITIMPRGQALGVTTHLPTMDKYSTSMDEYEARIDVCMGGKVAEELIYGPDRVTSGVSSDLTQATRCAYAMVTQFGMSSKLGNVDLNANHDRLSSGTKELIETEVRRLIEEGRQRATNLLTSKRKELELLAKALVEYETLDSKEAFKVIKGQKLDKLIMPPSSPIKVPEIGLGGIDGEIGSSLPPIPGSGKQEGSGKEPPAAGGAVA